jgi:hypothetical protein
VGLFRKSASIFTAGLIDFRSDKERTARYTKQIRDEARRDRQGAPTTAELSRLIMQRIRKR